MISFKVDGGGASFDRIWMGQILKLYKMLFEYYDIQYKKWNRLKNFEFLSLFQNIKGPIAENDIIGSSYGQNIEQTTILAKRTGGKLHHNKIFCRAFK